MSGQARYHDADRRRVLAWLGAGAAALAVRPARAELVQAVERIKQSVVGITLFAAASPVSQRLAGTGFAIADGQHIVTNYHVVRTAPDAPPTKLGALVPGGVEFDRRELTLLAVSPAHDLALLRLSGPPRKAVTLSRDPQLAPDGTAVAITGFPIGTVLGLVPATQTGIVSAQTPNISPQPDSRFLDAALLSTPRFSIYQLDLTAYPGHSGSPLYRADNGEVIGVLNATLIKSTKERVLADPSGISYAIPSGLVRDLAIRAGLTV